MFCGLSRSTRRLWHRCPVEARSAKYQGLLPSLRDADRPSSILAPWRPWSCAWRRERGVLSIRHAISTASRGIRPHRQGGSSLGFGIHRPEPERSSATRRCGDGGPGLGEAQQRPGAKRRRRRCRASARPQFSGRRFFAPGLHG